MASSRKVAIYSRVSTDHQTSLNQILELRSYAERMGYRIVAELRDEGISGARGRRDRPSYNRLLEMVARREVDLVLSWSVDRLSRSLPDLLNFLGELKAKGVDLYLHTNAIDTTTPAGRALYQLLGVFSEFEAAILKERIHAGLKRARAEGKRLGRPSVWDNPSVIASVKLLRANDMSIHKIASNLKLGVGTVSKILDQQSAA